MKSSKCNKNRLFFIVPTLISLFSAVRGPLELTISQDVTHTGRGQMDPKWTLGHFCAKYNPGWELDVCSNAMCFHGMLCELQTTQLVFGNHSKIFPFHRSIVDSISSNYIVNHDKHIKVSTSWDFPLYLFYCPKHSIWDVSHVNTQSHLRELSHSFSEMSLVLVFMFDKFLVCHR